MAVLHLLPGFRPSCLPFCACAFCAGTCMPPPGISFQRSLRRLVTPTSVSFVEVAHMLGDLHRTLYNAAFRSLREPYMMRCTWTLPQRLDRGSVLALLSALPRWLKTPTTRSYSMPKCGSSFNSTVRCRHSGTGTLSTLSSKLAVQIIAKHTREPQARAEALQRRIARAL